MEESTRTGQPVKIKDVLVRNGLADLAQGFWNPTPKKTFASINSAVI